jgi:hypothetical protein
MPPPNSGVAADPRIQELLAEIGNIMGARLHAHLQQVNATISPAGRPVDVLRRDENNKNIVQQTTTPQLLAELNDNLQDLIAEIQYANDKADGSSKPRRRRRG